MSNKKIIVVLGMHRSGTSVITRGLQVMGVVLGDRMMPAAEGNNDKGFWEDIDLNALNIEMLNAIGSDWYHVTAITSVDIDLLRKQGYYLRAAELLRQKIGSASVFGLKDPRIAKLLPFWKEVFNHCQLDVSYILAVRNPLSVAKSLAERDGIEAEQSYLLWLGHVVISLLHSSDDERIVVDYDRLMQSPSHELNRIANSISLEIDPVELESYETVFLDEGLRHTVYTINDLSLDATCPPIVREVYAALLNAASDNFNLSDAWAKNKILDWSDELERLRSPLLLIDRILAKKLVDTIEIEKRNDEIARLDLALAERDMQIAAHRSVVAERDAQLKSLFDSRSWRITRPLRWYSFQMSLLKELGLKARINAALKKSQSILRASTSSIIGWLSLHVTPGWALSPRQYFKQYTKKAFYIVKRNRHILPFSYKTQRSIYRYLHTKFPGLAGMYAVRPVTVKSKFFQNVAEGKAITYDKQSGDFFNAASAEYFKICFSDAPLVSVIIPVYGKIDYTLRCLASIAANPPQSTFEVIVVDDFSPDNSAEVLKGVNGIRLVSNIENQGFIRSCNIGAKAANGEYLYFLNNDTEVTTGWMDELLQTFSGFPGTGLAGSKLIYPDGSLQEAGGIIWQDGSAWNFGRLQDQLLPVYNYAREVDYCSGASIMVPKTLFEELDGFDEHYLPAYCEDSDLALKIRDKGYRVIYQPLSTIIHYEGITSGTDTTQGTKAYQVENSKKLFDRWKRQLQAHQVPGVDADNAKDRRATRRALVIDHCTPTPNQDAGSLTVFNLLLLLREMDFQVTFIPEDNFLYIPEYTAALQRAGVEVLYLPYISTVEQHLKKCGKRYDLAFLFRPGVVERHLKAIRKRCPKAKVLYHTVDLHFLRMSREAVLQSDKVKQKAADEMKQRELAAIRASDASIVHSTIELELLQAVLPDAKIHVFPLIMDVKGTNKSFAERKDIVFVGGYQHTPNIDAVEYFTNEIMPLLRQQLPGVRFYAVGSKPPSQIEALASEDVIITGFVEELAPFLDKMRVSVAPLRYGAGIKGKIGTAMAVGLPVVATPLAAEGMSLTDGENILVAESAKQFADAIVKLYKDEILWNSISLNGLEFSENAWGAEAAWSTFVLMLRDLGFINKTKAYPLILWNSLV